MIKTFLALLLTIFSLTPVWAAQGKITLKGMAVEEINYYAKHLYDRHDYIEATNAFQKVLTLDPNNKTALAYLKRMNQKPIECCALPETQALNVKPTGPVSMVAGSNDDIRRQIAEENQAIDGLNRDLSQLRQEAPVR